MLTLRSYLEALADSGRAYVVKEMDGYPWPPDELMEWLEWQDPERLEQAIWFSSLDGDGSGVLFALDAHGTVIGPGPLYRIERRQPSPPLAGPLPTGDRTESSD